MKVHPMRRLNDYEKSVCEMLAKLGIPKSKMRLDDGRVAILQNPEKNSLWAYLARSGKRVVQFVKEPAEYPYKWIGVAVDDTYVEYAQVELEPERAKDFEYGEYVVTAYYNGSTKPIAISAPRRKGVSA